MFLSNVSERRVFALIRRHTHLLLKGRTLTATFTEAMATRSAWTGQATVHRVKLFSLNFSSRRFSVRVTRKPGSSRRYRTSSTSPDVLRNVVVVAAHARRPTSSLTRSRQTDDCWRAAVRDKKLRVRACAYARGSLISSDQHICSLLVTARRARRAENARTGKEKTAGHRRYWRAERS